MDPLGTSVVPSSAARLAAAGAPAGSPKPPPSVEVGADGAVRLRMRLPKSEVARLMKESRDPAEAAERIMQLCVARDQGAAAPPALARPPCSALSSRNATTTTGTGLKKEVSRPHAHRPPAVSLSSISHPFVYVASFSTVLER